ncbi:type II toxin-antitoxin system RelE/ParE family toxin [Chryseobacterium indologenes]|uniref:type II toxin-antitoxin system RelE/ParE family toxin n=1 Tax=Chryseobacterium indologenes TaxID=253 RepID=UPI0003E077E0|nr:type II toxin-antitoxin system RelE/ParE family toxin [Chryseobacterium indologenes]QPQ50557.1 type II toxin-antitoxin system RelE/ParE family toxin [Chryseobacterium indologenes]GAE63022.1 plasmid maintenance system killer family protein [Chryseobacterium indologenes NBRC 14944]SFJ31686.1 proteic killer suppression protein [Chryseobacterium indologenes]SUX53224.1 Plasmid maintenance system killer protein [Chryseobacterium indologenes]
MGIESIKHKGLRLLYVEGDVSKVQPHLVKKIKIILSVIDTLEKVPEDLKGLRHLEPHKLQGNLSEFWAISVSGNYRIIFKFDSDTQQATHLDLIDYH